jgi:hypothetical protein
MTSELMIHFMAMFATHSYLVVSTITRTDAHHAENLISSSSSDFMKRVSQSRDWTSRQFNFYFGEPVVSLSKLFHVGTNVGLGFVVGSELI